MNQFIQVVDTATLALGAQIAVNENPSALTVTPSGLILMTDINNQLLVINPQTGTVVNQFTLPSEKQVMLGAIISSPDSTTAYMTFAGPAILAVNLQTGATVFDAPIDYLPTQFAISTDGQTLYSIDYSTISGAWGLSQFQIPTQKPVTTVSQLGPLSGLALARDGGSLYVLNANESAIVSVDIASQTPTHVTPGGVGINSLAIDPINGTVWASSYEFAAAGDILELNPATGQLTFATGPTGALTFSPSGTLYIANPAELIALDVPSMSQTGKLYAAQLENIGQAIPSPDGKYLYVSVTFVSGSPAQPLGESRATARRDSGGGHIQFQARGNHKHSGRPGGYGTDTRRRDSGMHLQLRTRSSDRDGQRCDCGDDRSYTGERGPGGAGAFERRLDGIRHGRRE